jgi:hypothetical protein
LLVDAALFRVFYGLGGDSSILAIVTILTLSGVLGRAC